MFLNFSILDYLDRLEPDGGANNRNEKSFFCPHCGAENFKVSLKKGCFQTFSCDCGSTKEGRRGIFEALGVPSTMSKSIISRTISRTSRPRRQTKQAKKPAPIPGELTLKRIEPAPPLAQHFPRAGNLRPKNQVPATATETRYPYSDWQWVYRWDFLDEKGRKKICRPVYRDDSGDLKIGLGDGEWLPYAYKESALAEGNVWLVVEGEKCVEAARSIGLAAITLPGAKWSEEPLKSLCDLVKSGTRPGSTPCVVFLLDADSAGESKGDRLAEAAAKAGVAYLKIGTRTLAPSLDEKGDIADLVSGGKGVEAREPGEIVAALERAIAAAAKALPPEEEEEEEKEEKPSKPPKEDLLGAELAEDLASTWAYDGTRRSWAIYESRTRGVWSAVDNEEVEALIDKELDKRGISGYGSNKYVSNVIGKLKRVLFTAEWTDDKNLLPFADCVVELDSGKIREHSPANRLRWALPHNYYSATGEAFPKIDAWLSEITLGNSAKKEKLLCFAAAVLRRRSDLQRFVHLIGLGGSGKSTYANLLMQMIGKENSDTVSLESLSDKEKVSRIFGLQLLVFADQDETPRNAQLAAFKRLTGQDPLECRPLYKPGFSAVYDGMVLMTSNSPVFAGATSKWLSRRACTITINHQILPSQKRDLLAEFTPELGAFTRYALSIENARINSALSEEDRGISADFWAARCNVDTLAEWANEYLIQEVIGNVAIGSNTKEWADYNEYDPACSTLFGSYSLHCFTSGAGGASSKVFSRNLQELLAGVLGWQIEVVVDSATRRKLIKGVRLRQKGEQTPTIWELLASSQPGPKPEPAREVAEQVAESDLRVELKKFRLTCGPGIFANCRDSDPPLELFGKVLKNIAGAIAWKTSAQPRAVQDYAALQQLARKYELTDIFNRAYAGLSPEEQRLILDEINRSSAL